MKSRGFVLTEVLVALFISTVILTTFLNSISQALLVMQRAENFYNALNVVEEKIFEYETGFQIESSQSEFTAVKTFQGVRNSEKISVFRPALLEIKNGQGKTVIDMNLFSRDMS